jgi:hypothetical protein
MGTIQQMLLGEYATTSTSLYWNPSDKAAELTLSNAFATCLRSTTNDGAWRMVRGVSSHNTGKWYAEILIDANGAGNGSVIFGLALAGAGLSGYVGSDANSLGIQPNNTANVSTYFTGGQTTFGTSLVAGPGDRAMVAIDIDAGKVWFGSKGTWLGSGNPAAGTGQQYNVSPQAFYLALSESLSPAQTTLKSRSGDNLYTPPTGFSMWG